MSSASPKFCRPKWRRCTKAETPLSSTTRRTSEKPLECRPDEETPISTSPAVIASVFGRVRRVPPRRPQIPRVEIPAGVEARHLGRLAADQRAARFGAGLRDALDDRCAASTFSLPAGVVVEEKQRLRALHHDVVDAHRDKVLSESAETPGFDGDL